MAIRKNSPVRNAAFSVIDGTPVTVRQKRLLTSLYIFIVEFGNAHIPSLVLTLDRPPGIPFFSCFEAQTCGNGLELSVESAIICP
jgi:hypothetical protein